MAAGILLLPPPSQPLDGDLCCEKPVWPLIISPDPSGLVIRIEIQEEESVAV
jgi:hypothetical protein